MLSVFSVPACALTLQKRLFQPYMVNLLTTWGRRRWERKPVDEAIAACPEWYAGLRFAFDFFIGALELDPEIGTVATLEFMNPSGGGPSLLEEDLGLISRDLIDGAARRAMGNKMEDGRLMVNGRVQRKFDVDCRGKIDVWLEVPHYESEALRAVAAAAGVRQGVACTLDI